MIEKLKMKKSAARSWGEVLCEGRKECIGDLTLIYRVTTGV